MVDPFGLCFESTMKELKKILRLDREELIQAFRKASVSGKGTPDHVADARETALRQLLGRYFPYPYHVVKGIISDAHGNRSASIDAVVVNPIHPHTMLNGGRSPFFLAAEGVDYAIELKPNLGNSAEIERALRQIQTVKKLRRATDGLLTGRKKLSAPLRKLALRIPCILFAERSYGDTKRLVKRIVSHYKTNGIPTSQQFDMICIADGTLVMNSSKTSHFYLNADGLVFRDFGEDVLYYFLFFLLRIPPSTPRIKADILSHYIERPPTDGWKTFNALNAELREIDDTVVSKDQITEDET